METRAQDVKQKIVKKQDDILQEKILAARNALKTELNAKLKRIDETPSPKAKPSTFVIKETIICLSIIVVCILALYFSWRYISGFIALVISVIALIFLAFAGLGLFYMGNAKEAYTKKINNYEEWKKNEKKKIIEQYEQYAYNIAKYGKREAPIPKVETPKAPTPKCPVCGSDRVLRISNTSRVVSVAMIGLASSKIGKQYECLNCKHKW